MPIDPQQPRLRGAVIVDGRGIVDPEPWVAAGVVIRRIGWR